MASKHTLELKTEQGTFELDTRALCYIGIRELDVEYKFLTADRTSTKTETMHFERLLDLKAVLYGILLVMCEDQGATIPANESFELTRDVTITAPSMCKLYLHPDNFTYHYINTANLSSMSLSFNHEEGETLHFIFDGITRLEVSYPQHDVNMKNYQNVYTVWRIYNSSPKKQ